MTARINVGTGRKVFAATLADNASARALAAQLPLYMTVSELNGNEKYVDLATELPTEPKRVGSIRAGDLMLYGSDCLVLFYEGFSTSYRYTELGRLEDPAGLADALGRESVRVTLSPAT